MIPSGKFIAKLAELRLKKFSTVRWGDDLFATGAKMFLFCWESSATKAQFKKKNGNLNKPSFVCRI